MNGFARWRLRKARIRIAVAAVFLCVLAHAISKPNLVGEAQGDEPPRNQIPKPGVEHVDRLDFGELHVGTIAEAELDVTFHGVTNTGLEIQVEPPPFASVRCVRTLRRGQEQPGVVWCRAILSVLTKSVAKQKGEIKVRLGDQVAKVPLIASVLPQVDGKRKVLLISNGFGSASHRADYYRPWFNLVHEAKLDVGYIENYGGMVFPRGQPGPDGLYPIPQELARYDVILVADGGIVHMNNNAALLLMQFADSGKRVIITASPGLGDSVIYANRILEPLGMRMVDHEVIIDGRMKPIEAAKLEADGLLEGVAKLVTSRPAPIHVLDSEKAKILAYFPNSQDGLVAVSRKGDGEVVALGMWLLSSWIGEDGAGADNARLLKNLLTGPAAR